MSEKKKKYHTDSTSKEPNETTSFELEKLNIHKTDNASSEPKPRVTKTNIFFSKP
jgi:hypothetical protein